MSSKDPQSAMKLSGRFAFAFHVVARILLMARAGSRRVPEDFIVLVNGAATQAALLTKGTATIGFFGSVGRQLPLPYNMRDSILPVPASRSLPETIYAQVVESILRGDFAQTGKLPTETQLAGRFGVSRPTVREALSRLRSDGIVSSRRGAGSYVIRAPHARPPLPLPIRSLADVERYYAFRTCVEAGAAAGAAEFHTPGDLQAIRDALEALATAVAADRWGVEEDVQFHMAIARASHNPFFVSTLEASVGPIRQFIELARNVTQGKDLVRDQEVQREHQAIVDAIVRRSPADAAEATRAHTVAARRRIFEGTQLF